MEYEVTISEKKQSDEYYNYLTFYFPTLTHAIDFITTIHTISTYITSLEKVKDDE